MRLEITRQKMNLSKAQRGAMLELGNSASGHDFVPPGVLEELLALELVYWRTPEDLDFTSAGEKVYHELATE
jgi:hypothetical protein